MSPQLSQDDINKILEVRGVFQNRTSQNRTRKKILEVRGVFQKSNITKPDARHCSWHVANLAQ